MSKNTHFIGQPIFSQLIKLFNKENILELSRNCNGERYVKSFDGWHHLLTMLYAVIRRFDSLREIEASMLAEAHKLSHLGISNIPRRSTLSDANARRPECFFEQIYRNLYSVNKDILSSDSRHNGSPKWMEHLKIMDSTTISLFSNVLFKGVGRNPKSGKKKGGLKVHTVIHANEGVPSDIKVTSAATHDHFMLSPGKLSKDDILTIDRAYIDYEKFAELTDRGVVYVTKMKKNMKYKLHEDIMLQDPDGLMQVRIQKVTLTKELPDRTIIHRARIITYSDIKKKKLIFLLTNDFEMDPLEIIEIYRKRWAIELLFKQLKQNFPLRYFYGESKNAIMIQIWVTLIANLLLTIKQRSLKRSWSFSGMATMVRIMLMYYIDFHSFFEQPEKGWNLLIESKAESPPMPTLFG